MARQARTMKDPKEFTVLVGTAATQVLPRNESRRYLQLINDSDSIIYVSIRNSGTPELNKGTRLNANGGAAVFDNLVPTGSITAICGTADKRLLVTESGNE
jgi:hypothetical protein